MPAKRNASSMRDRDISLWRKEIQFCGVSILEGKCCHKSNKYKNADKFNGCHLFSSLIVRLLYYKIIN